VAEGVVFLVHGVNCIERCYKAVEPVSFDSLGIFFAKLLWVRTLDLRYPLISVVQSVSTITINKCLSSKLPV
jgi:hypothetical protein